MLISVCIPHYNRSKYLLAVLESIRIQDYPEVEVVISDDCSTDDSAEVIPRYISEAQSTTHVRFNYIRQQKNLGYDGNLRAALDAGQGEYLFALGNDDALPNKDTLSRLAGVLEQLKFPDVSFSNFHLFGKPKEIQRRALSTTIIGSGPDVAVKSFRSFSFVGGFVIKRSAFRKHNTAKHDGSVYVQIFLAARTIASGGTLGTISESLVAKDVRFPGEEINSYLDVLVRNNRRFHRELGGLDQVGRVACDAILPSVAGGSRQRYLLNIYSQLLLYTYPYWLLNYRKQGVYRAAVNLSLGCFPAGLVKVSDVTPLVRLWLTILWSGSTTIGLVFPVKLLGRMARSIKQLQSRAGSLFKTGNELPVSS